MPIETIRFGAHKLPRESYPDFESMRSRNLDMLARCLNLHTTVAVVGAGCSVSRGYVSWTGFAEKLLEATIEKLQEGPNQLGLRRRIEGMARYLAEEERAENGTLMYFIGACKQAILGAEDYDRASAENRRAFAKIIHDLFFEGTYDPDPDRNPYGDLLKLPIWRLVTTNYDREIERAIEAKEERCSSITQEDRFTDELTRFALTDIPKSRRYSVFHCHGRYDQPSSIIAGEADYQRWYLGRHRKTGSAFRQSIELLFESNPLLFVGYGLGDEDLLRPLRVLGALDPERKASRPIFALMPWKGERDRYQMQQLYERYGLQVISYEQPSREEDPTGRLHTQRFCEALQQIHEHWLMAQAEWYVKPPPRKVVACRLAEAGQAPTNWRWREPIAVPTSAGQSEIQCLEAQLTGDDRPSILGFVGPSGCGKSRQIRGLLEELRHRGTPPRGPFESCYYWNAHYINEGMTGIDQLLDFLEADDGPEVPRFRRLLNALDKKTSLVVLDGAERLLQPIDRPLLGKPINGYVRQLLEIFSRPDNATTVVWVGRLWPVEFVQPRPEAPPASSHLVPASRIHREDMEQFLREVGRERLLTRGNGRAEGRLSALVALLNGHSYGLLLALDLVWRDLEGLPDESWSTAIEPAFGKVQRELAKSRLDSRLPALIRFALEDLDRDTQGLASRFLRTMALSLNALSLQALEIIYEQTAEERRKILEKRRQRRAGDAASSEETIELLPFSVLLPLLHGRHLIVPMPRVHEATAEAEEGESTSTYAVHFKIRGYFHADASLPEDPLPSLTLSGVSSGGHGVDPGRDGHRAKRLVETLLRRGHEALEEARPIDEAGDLEARTQLRRAACDLCRDAYSIVRARMDANTAPRWTHYSSYVTLGIRVAKLAKAIAEEDQIWDHRDTQDRGELEDWQGALFLGEMAWLYNDVGLALYGEGLMADAYAVWEQALEISHMIEEDEIYGGSYQIQSLLNLSYAFLELGRPSSAREYITRAEGMNRTLNDPSLGARIRGFQGLIHHLSGNLREAERCYTEALGTLENETTDYRALSYFHKYRGDLLLASGRPKEAEDDIRAANIFAEEGRYPDLLIEAQMSLGRIRMFHRDWTGARLHYKASLRAARRIHSRRLEAAVLCNIARLALEQGDSGGARYQALRSLKLANEMQLGLRVSHSLVVLGLATLESGQRELGVAYLRQAQNLAERQQYWFRAQEAELKLQELGEEARVVAG